jgi:CheY-like chemotaxis protein
MSCACSKLSGKNILLVDKDTQFVASGKEAFEKVGAHVITASSAAEAEKAFNGAKPDLVVTEVMLETEDKGFTLCYTIKKQTPDLPIIIVSDVNNKTALHFDASTIEERRWIKADAFINKPIRFEQLCREAIRLLK